VALNTSGFAWGYIYVIPCSCSCLHTSDSYIFYAITETSTGYIQHVLTRQCWILVYMPYRCTPMLAALTPHVSPVPSAVARTRNSTVSGSERLLM
jgi:hypothetical protein